MSNFQMNPKDILISRKNELKRLIKFYKKKLSNLHIEVENLKSEYEIPMPLKYNKITDKNNQNEKSYKYTKKLIKKLKQRSISNINIKKEVEEEIEMPPLEYA